MERERHGEAHEIEQLQTVEAFQEHTVHDRVARDHGAIRQNAASLRGLIERVRVEPASPALRDQLVVAVQEFARRLFDHFALEESSCIAAKHAPSSPAQRWVETMCAQHVELRRRIEATIAALEARTDGVDPERAAEVAGFLEELAKHELTEARLFQVSVLGH